MEEYQCFEHSLNTAVDEVPESPLSSTLFGYANRFDSGLRHDLKPLIFKGFFDVWIYLHPSGSPLIYPKLDFDSRYFFD